MSKLEIGINDLETFCKQNNRLDLLEEWDCDKNGFNPNSICYGTAQKVWWTGKCGHSWQASLNKRTSDKTGCPYCPDSHAKLLSGFNDLATTNPELLPFWDYEKNGTLLPSMVMKGQHRKVWWKGECGHSWESSVYHRVQGRGCPICRNETQTSFQEQAIFYYLKRVFDDTVSRDITILNGKELDIFIPSINTAVEFDGSVWHKNIKKDEKKNLLCEKKGIILYRIRDIDCPKLTDSPNVHIIDFNSYTDFSLEKSIINLLEMLKVRTDVNINRDRVKILEQFLVQKKEKSLAESFPEISKEWNYVRNGELTPELVTRRSDKKVWWKCEKGHEWQANVHSRTKGHGCPYCNSNRLLSGYNDLATLYPDLISMYDETKNGFSASDISPFKKLSLHWRCKNGHSFKRNLKTMINNYANLDATCPICYQSQIENLLASKQESSNSSKQNLINSGWRKAASLTIDKTNPESLTNWDYEKNIIQPNEITLGSSKKVWWKCPKGHSYESSPNNHLSLHKGCPYCSNTKLLVGFNDLQTVAPNIALEWNYKRNNGLKPSEVLAGGYNGYWWICEKGHEWKATFATRKKGCGCPVCAGNTKKGVRNIDTGVVYKSLTEAAKSCGLKVGDTISLCCQGKQNTAGGYHWEYVESSNNSLD